MAGVNLPTVKELMGHKHITTTLRYAHLSSDHKHMAVRRLEQFAAKVPRIFTTPRTVPASNDVQVVEFSGMGR
jgi:hypothetical protein